MTITRSLCLGATLCVVLIGALSAEQTGGSAKITPKTSEAAPAMRPWPRTFDQDGTQITLHQPQFDDWQGNSLSGRMAIAVKTGSKTGSDGEPHDTLSYGAMWFKARTDIDKVARQVMLSNFSIEKVSFPADRLNEAKYSELLKRIAKRSASRIVSLDLLESALAINRETKIVNSVAVKNDPPDVLFSFEPALLVLIDGNAVVKPSGTAGVERVVNTRSLVLKQGDRYFLNFAGRWVSSPDIAGPWSAAGKVSPALDQAKTAAEKSKVVDLLDQPSDALKKVLESGKLPSILVRTKPAELIMVDGDPQFVDIDGTDLAYVANTGSDVFIDKSKDNFWYVLISGRWFAAPSSNGPWAYMSGNVLPAGFAKIPPESPKSAVLASIPDTPESRESLIANSIPQTATVKRSQASLQVDYDGAPEFKPIEGTALSYAWNTGVPVIRVADDAYYAVQNGVWFTASSPVGLWRIPTEVPAVIYSIPASSPVHYVTYVRVYGANDDDVYVGYTPGYYGTVVSSGVVVYGTGYTCDPWIGAYWYGCPATYGFAVNFGYDPWVGWTFGYGWGWGWACAWYGPWWGPWGYWGNSGYWPGYWGGGIATANIYGRWGNSVVSGVGAGWANPWTGNYGRAARGGYHNEVTGGRGVGYAGRNTNIYTGTTTAAAGGIRYNPQTGRVVAGQGAAAYNPYSGNAVAGGSRTTVNTNTGRVTETAGMAGKNDSGAAAIGGFNTQGKGGDAKGAGYVKYDSAAGDVSTGGIANINDSIYAGKDGNVYKYEGGDWQQVGGDGNFNKATELPSAGNIDSDRMARERGADRDFDRGAGGDMSRGNGGARQFDRSNYNGDYKGQMGGTRPAAGGGRYGGGGGRGGGGRRR
jgi:hypothetical protein